MLLPLTSGTRRAIDAPTIFTKKLKLKINLFLVINATNIKYEARLHNCRGNRLMLMVSENIELYWNSTARASTKHKIYFDSSLLFLNIKHKTIIFDTK